MRELLSSKIHNATVTMARLDYVGSITIDPLLTEKANLWPGQKVLVVSHRGARLETYVIVGEHPGNGEICMNGPAAHLICEGDRIIVMGFEFASKPVQPTVVLVDAANRFERYLAERPNMTAAEAPTAPDPIHQSGDILGNGFRNESIPVPSDTGCGQKTGVELRMS